MSKQIIIFVIAVIVIVALVVLGLKSREAGTVPAGEQGAALGTQGQNLVAEDLVVGSGAEATQGSTISVHYTGTLIDGTVFDSSVTRGTPFTFTLGAGQVIPGWEQGIPGMKVGGKRRLNIAPELAYGNQAVGPIPANSPLIFEVELLSVNAAPAASGTSTDEAAS